MGDYLDVGANPEENDNYFLSGEITDGSDDVYVSDVEDEDDDDADVAYRFEKMCRHEECSDGECLELRSLVARVEEFMRLGNSKSVSKEVLSTFKRILWHSRRCDETQCHVPFCEYFSSHLYENWHRVLPWLNQCYVCSALGEYWKLVDLKEVIIMDTRVPWPSGRVAPEQPRIGDFNSPAERFWRSEQFPMEVEHHFVYPSVVDSTGTRYAPRPGTDFKIRWEFLKEARYVCFAEARVAGFPFEIKMEQCFFKSRKDYLDDHVTNLRRLVDCHHENLSHLLCLYVPINDSFISAYRYDLGDRSLEEVCGKVGNSHGIRQIMLGLVKGARFLHQKGLFFLNWKASALSCSKSGNGMTGKLYDFQCVFDFGRRSEQELSNDENLDAIVECLDASCIPSELLQYPKQAGMFTEPYGVGAIMCHLITGKPLLYEFRHEGRNQQIQAVASLVPEELGLGEQRQEFASILANLLGPHQDRMRLEELEKLLC